MSLREFKGGAKPTTVSGDFNAAATSFSVDDATGWPDGSVGPFTIVVNRTGATAEKMLATARTGTIPATITVPLPNRGYDDTAAAQHFTGEAVEHVGIAEDMRDANAHIFDTATDAHTQYLTTTRHDTTARHGAAVVDHGGIGGLADDDHGQYLHTSLPRTLNDVVLTPAAVGDRLFAFQRITGQTASMWALLDVGGTAVLAELEPDGDLLGGVLTAKKDTQYLLVLDRLGGTRTARIGFKQAGTLKWTLGQDKDAVQEFILYDEENGRYALFVDAAGNVGLAGLGADFAGGGRLVGIRDAATAPTANPTTGALLYSLAQVFKIRDSEGIKTPFGREIVTAAGDILTATGSGTITRKAIGADTAPLVVDTTAADKLKYDNGAWTSFTPTWTAVTTNPAVGNGTLVGRFKQRGKIVHLAYELTMGSTTTFGSGTWSLGLPGGMTSAAGINQVMALSLLDTSVQWTAGAAVVDAGATTLRMTSQANNDYFGSANPIPWATGDSVRIGGTLEIA